MEKLSLLNTHFRFFVYTTKATTKLFDIQEEFTDDPILKNLYKKESKDSPDAFISFYLEDVTSWSQAWTEDEHPVTKVDFVDTSYYITDTYEQFHQVMLDYQEKIKKLLWIELYDMQG
jgi:hypothetical protein